MTYRPLTDLAVTIADGANLDAFSRLRVGDPYSLFSIQSQYDLEPLRMEVSGSGPNVTYDSTTGEVSIAGGSTGATAIYQSYQYFPYQPGKSQLIFITGRLTDLGSAGTPTRIYEYGYGDALNGVFFRAGSDVANFLIRSNGSERVVAQSSWNLDPLDGTGPSGKSLGVTASFILVIDLQFLGMGRVRCGFDIDGTVVYAHEFLNAGVITGPYMRTATLPIRVFTSNNQFSPAFFKCATVISEGGVQETGFSFSTPETVSGTLVANTRTHFLSLRPKTTFAGRTNRQELLPDELDILVTGNNPVYWELAIGSTFSVAPTYADVNATYSGTEYGVTGTVATVGTVIASGYVTAGTTIKGAIETALTDLYPLTLSSAGNHRDFGTLNVFVTALGGTSVVRGSITFHEVR